MLILVRRAVGLAIAAVFLSSTVALAGNGATVTHFTIHYTVDYGDPIGLVTVDCTGDRIVKTAPNPVVKDIEVCTIDKALLEPSVYLLAGFGWWSDYEMSVWEGPYTSPPCDQAEFDYYGICARVATSGSVTVTYSKKTGLYTWDVTAYYAP